MAYGGYKSYRQQLWEEDAPMRRAKAEAEMALYKAHLHPADPWTPLREYQQRFGVAGIQNALHAQQEIEATRQAPVLSMIDPVTNTVVDAVDAVYLQPNMVYGRPSRVYHDKTIKGLMSQGNFISPETKKKFRAVEVRRLEDKLPTTKELQRLVDQIQRRR